MTELQEAVQKTSESSYVQDLAKDLELLLDVAFALRSVSEGLGAEDGIECWLKGQDWLAKTPNPCPDKIKYLGRPVTGITKEYEVVAPSGENYRFVVKPRHVHNIPSNKVRIKYSKTYREGTNPDPGVLVGPDNHDVMYLLPLIAKLPIPHVSYQAVKEFFEQHNGFKISASWQELSQFWDTYRQKNREKQNYQPIQWEKPAPWLKEVRSSLYEYTPAEECDVSMDVYVTIKPTRLYDKVTGKTERAVTIELEIEIPEKKV